MPDISVQKQDFNQHTLYEALRQQHQNTGAIVTFTGLVREFCGSTPLTLEHYPGMTEKVLEHIADSAMQQWSLNDVKVVHRIGALAPAEQIVFVGVASPHRTEAFAACEYIIDILKTRAPFWKKEGNNWVKAKEKDQSAAETWLKNSDSQSNV